MECVFCNELATYKFRNKYLCQDCVEKIKLIYNGKNRVTNNVTDIEEIQKTDIEKKYEDKEKEILKKTHDRLSKKKPAPVIIGTKRI